MPVFLHEDSKILFAHVPKTGGTSVERLFTNSGYKMAYRDGKVGPSSLNWLRRCSPQHLHAEMLDQVFRVERFDLVFMVVREPIARFRSEYSHRNREDLRTDRASVDAWTETMLAKYADNPYLFDNHVRPQHEFELPGCEVYRLEDGLEAMADDLRERFGLRLQTEVPHAMDRVRRTGISSTAVEVSPRTEERLRDFYAGDFERFGY